MCKRTQFAVVAAFSLMTAFAAHATPISVVSTLFDYDRDALTVGPLATDPTGQAVQNGDFIIFAIGADQTTGNGVDDWTKGIFDFRSDANYLQLSSVLAQPHGKVFSAILNMVLTPFSLFTNDMFSLENGPFLGDPEIGQQLTSNPLLGNQISKIVTINLRDYYSQQQLENYLSFGTGDYANDGRILLTYADDAIMSAASLTITANIPEPSSFLMVLLPLAMLLNVMRTRAKLGA